jgi:hypothetical protein
MNVHINAESHIAADCGRVTDGWGLGCDGLGSWKEGGYLRLIPGVVTKG